VLRLREAPLAVRSGRTLLPRLSNLRQHTEGYTVEAIADSGFVVRIQHEHAGDIRIQLGTERTMAPSP
jgi:hypothetical protein